jgi:hypothetical protein
VRILAEVHYSLNFATEYFFLAECYKRLLKSTFLAEIYTDKVALFVVAATDHSLTKNLGAHETDLL